MAAEDLDQLPRRPDPGEGPEEQRVDHGEHGRVQPDTERQGQDRDARKGRVFGQQAPGRTEIVPQGRHLGAPWECAPVGQPAGHYRLNALEGFELRTTTSEFVAPATPKPSVVRVRRSGER